MLLHDNLYNEVENGSDLLSVSTFSLCIFLSDSGSELDRESDRIVFASTFRFFDSSTQIRDHGEP